MTETPRTITGRRFDAEATRQHLRDQIDAGLDRSQGASRTGSKTAATGIIPIVFAGIAGTLKFFRVPESVCSAVAGLGGAKVAGYADSIADSSTRSTTSVARAALHKSADSSAGSTASVANWIVSWFR
ncbi:MAG: hypothetical protein P0S96_01535 [Simkaniaceae bacterium]|nr:hypothetical protein [Candidatus Sacchlamyda saccharinae]